MKRRKKGWSDQKRKLVAGLCIASALTFLFGSAVMADTQIEIAKTGEEILTRVRQMENQIMDLDAETLAIEAMIIGVAEMRGVLFAILQAAKDTERRTRNEIAEQKEKEIDRSRVVF